MMGISQFSHGRVRLKHILVASFLVATVYWLRLGHSNSAYSHLGLSPDKSPSGGSTQQQQQQPQPDTQSHAGHDEPAKNPSKPPTAASGATHQVANAKTVDSFEIFPHFDQNTIKSYLDNEQTAGWIENLKGKGLSGEDAAHEGVRQIMEGMRGAEFMTNPIEKQVRHLFEVEQKARQRQITDGHIFGKTLNNLTNNTAAAKKDPALKPTEKVAFTDEQPYTYDPYAAHASDPRKRPGFVPCKGPHGAPEDVKVFHGRLSGLPEPAFGSNKLLGIDDSLCFERDTRLGPYGLKSSEKDYDGVEWGKIQDTCVSSNQARFEAKPKGNPYLSHYAKSKSSSTSHALRDDAEPIHIRRRGAPASSSSSSQGGSGSEERSAVLLRSYSGKDYTANDAHTIRSLVTELNIKTGGQYQVFLLVQVKDNKEPIWSDEAAYDRVLKANVPAEFRDMTVLWDDEAVQSTYPEILPTVADVHTAQWLPVQIFSQQWPEFAHIWNWELDARLTGHNFDYLEKLATWAKKQPRRGIWERSERYYVPSEHGDYDTTFRKEVEKATTDGGIWGPIDLPFVTPIGPQPPVAFPEQDDYQWGVDEEADMITFGPIMDTEGSPWIVRDQCWGYENRQVPRRGTIITQSRVSRRLLNIMHVENLRGNHVVSEMTPQTNALHHGLKAVYAPIPVYFDRPWSGKDVTRWFNCGSVCGPKTEKTTLGSPVGWGRESRFAGTTWYFRATPPTRLYLNWLGHEDTALGGAEWESSNGRPCLPSVFLHPIKKTDETESGFVSESKLAYE